MRETQTGTQSYGRAGCPSSLVTTRPEDNLPVIVDGLVSNQRRAVLEKKSAARVPRQTGLSTREHLPTPTPEDPEPAALRKCAWLLGPRCITASP